MKRTLVTGATGAIAPFLIHRQLHAAPAGNGDSPSFVCVSRRADAPESLRRRIEALCPGCAERVASPRFEFVSADVVHSIPVDGPLASVWHFASDLRMDPSAAEAVTEANLAATDTVLAFCARRSVPLYFLSTAYVCGTRTGPVHEAELDSGQRFRNAYEESKARSEERMRRWMEDHEGIVFRPSIVAGDTRSGVSLSFQGLYRMIWCLWRLRDRLLHTTSEILPDMVLRLPLPLPCSSSETRLNVVGADYVADLLDEIHRRPDAIGKTFHIVNPTPPTLEELLDVTVRLMGVKGIRLVELGEAVLEKFDKDFRRLTEWLGDQVMVYFPYISGRHPTFDMANVRSVLGAIPEHAPLDEATLGRMYQYALDRDFTAV